MSWDADGEHSLAPSSDNAPPCSRKQTQRRQRSPKCGEASRISLPLPCVLTSVCVIYFLLPRAVRTSRSAGVMQHGAGSCAVLRLRQMPSGCSRGRQCGLSASSSLHSSAAFSLLLHPHASLASCFLGKVVKCHDAENAGGDVLSLICSLSLVARPLGRAVRARIHN